MTKVADRQDPGADESTGKDLGPYQCLCEEFVAVCEATALAASVWHGRGDGLSADLAAREAMLGALDEMDFRGKVIVGRGGADSPCELRVGQEVGRGWTRGAAGAGATDTEEPSLAWDLAVDALEGRSAVAKGQAGALAVIAAGPAGSFMSVPEMYMQKIVVPGEAAGVTEIDAPVADNVRAVAAALGRPPSELSVVILDRPRHEELIAQVKKSGARVTLIGDGAIRAGIAAAARVPGVDMSIGIGGSTEGIITAAALQCIAGQIQARFWPVSRHQVEQLRALSIGSVEATLTTTDLVGKNVVFAATAVTDGRFLKGVSSGAGLVRTETILMCSRCHKIRLVKAISGEAAGRGIAAWAR